jgi:hypothetical protein
MFFEFGTFRTSKSKNLTYTYTLVYVKFHIP